MDELIRHMIRRIWTPSIPSKSDRPQRKDIIIEGVYIHVLPAILLYRITNKHWLNRRRNVLYEIIFKSKYHIIIRKAVVSSN